jgi:LAO/AO transport system kinase
LGADPHSLAQAVLDGDRRALARAITLCESTRPQDRYATEILLDAVLPRTGGAIRLGITGVPGVGKSTFIESWGQHIVGLGKRLAVLAVDPTSPKSGGSILGDKTRMEQLSRSPNAFIRPSPSGGTLGGVARRSRETLLLCEAAGFDVVLVETVGVGQSETAVAEMTDMFLLLLAPGSGDELQGIKRGIVEMADAVFVTKADGDLAEAAKRAQRDYANALHLLYPGAEGRTPPVLLCSAMTGTGLPEAWAAVERFIETALADGGHARRRQAQADLWLTQEVTQGLLERAQADAAFAEGLEAIRKEVAAGAILPSAAAARLLDRLLTK